MRCSVVLSAFFVVLLGTVSPQSAAAAELPDGVTIEGAELKFDSELYNAEMVTVKGKDVVALSKKGKKKKKGTVVVGVTCQCGGDMTGGVCNISMLDKETARCDGDQCCGLVVMAGETIPEAPANQ